MIAVSLSVCTTTKNVPSVAALAAVVGANAIKEDGSNPGAEFAKRVANEVMNSVIVTLPPGMDINDYYLAHGADATRALILGEKSE